MDKRRCLDLSKYRFERAKNSIKVAKRDLTYGDFNESVSRSYYAIFYAMLAVTELEGFESAKHSGVISHFTFQYLRTNIFDNRLSKLINSAFKLRRNADYEGFYFVSVEDVQKQIDEAEEIISIIQPYLESQWTEMEDKS